MPGKRITDHQVHKYKQHRNKLTQVAAAAKAGISERSARRIEARATRCRRNAQPRHWRTREDPLAEVWDDRGRAAAAGRRAAQRRHAAGGTAAPPPGRVRRPTCCARCSGACASGAPCTAPSARSSSPRSIRPGGWACRTSPSPTSSASRSAAPRSRTGCTSSRWRTRAGAMPRWSPAARASMALSAGLQDGAVAARRRARGTPHRQPVGGVQQPGRAAGADPALRGAVPPLRHARQPLQPGAVARERRHRVAPRLAEDGARPGAAAARQRATSTTAPAYEAFVDEIVQRFNARAAQRLAAERADAQAAAGAAHRRVRGDARAGEQVRASSPSRARSTARPASSSATG